MRLFLLLLAILMASPSLLFASTNPVSIEDQAKITEIVDQIPTRDGNLGKTLSKYGLHITSVITSMADTEDAEDAPELYKKGDKFVDVYFSVPLPELPCPIEEKASFIYRDGKYLPEQGTAGWLMNGECKKN